MCRVPIPVGVFVTACGNEFCVGIYLANRIVEGFGSLRHALPRRGSRKLPKMVRGILYPRGFEASISITASVAAPFDGPS